jgi:high-affinity iron transporter
MLAAATIIFREILEIALVLGIVMAATRGLKGRSLLALAGLGLGILGSVIIAFFTESIANAIDGMGQEIFNAAIMFTAVGFLGWTVIWMRTHGRELARHLKETGQDILSGHKSVYVLVGVVALATFREGAEIVLFTYGMTASGAYTLAEIGSGAIVGALGGIAVGAALYLGLLRAAQKYLFAVTGWMLILLTAGMAASGANFLIAAGILPTLSPELWDTSAYISASSLPGEILKVLIGYTPRPTGMEALFHVATLLTLGTLYTLMPSTRKPTPAEIKEQTAAAE